MTFFVKKSINNRFKQPRGRRKHRKQRGNKAKRVERGIQGKNWVIRLFSNGRFSKSVSQGEWKCKDVNPDLGTLQFYCRGHGSNGMVGLLYTL